MTIGSIRDGVRGDRDFPVRRAYNATCSRSRKNPPLGPSGGSVAYYQEVGRAGRDGEPAWGLLLHATQDLPRRRSLIESDAAGGSVDPAIVAHKWQQFLDLMRWAEGGSCRHDAVLRYFGDEAEELHGCGHCDVCESLDGADEAPEDATDTVRKALAGVARVHNRFGLTMAAKLLAGAEDERFGWSGLDKVKTYGVLKEKKEAWLVRLLRRCVTAGWVDFTGGDRPLVLLTREGTEVMFGRRPARLLLPPERMPATAATGRKRKAAAAEIETLDDQAKELFDRLRAWRLELARKDQVPPYVVASDRTLRDIACQRPKTREALLLAHGIGPTKAAQYGEEVLRLVAEST